MYAAMCNRRSFGPPHPDRLEEIMFGLGSSTVGHFECPIGTSFLTLVFVERLVALSFDPVVPTMLS